MQKAKFPHMEWAKAHTLDPAPIELGFSGAGRPPGAPYREFGSGDPVLEAKIASRYGVAPDHVYLTGGTSLANFVALAALVRRGGVVGVERPRYAPLAEIPEGLGGSIVDIRRRPDGKMGSIPREAELVVCTSPHNPTGRLLTEPDWRKLARFADRGGFVLVDEVYRDLSRKAKLPAVAASRHPRFVTTGGITKTYGLGGLRLGWVLAAPDLLARIKRVDNLVSVQCATPSILLLRRIWDRLPALRRDNMRPIARNLATLRKSGIEFIEPEAGLTVFARVGNGDRCAKAMAERGVGVATGSFFGDNRYVRLFLGADPAVFREGIARLKDYLGSVKRT
ncbi:MAG: pyridoxal phosphate-dependent aminotransferase [Planctomycetota bacterium]|jgi:aspartate/methionine/tyrosine aminotransferase